MKLTEIITQIDLNQQQIDAHGKLNDAVLKVINYKFRLDWNYYSNHMEGGTLTRDETRSVMVGNIEVHGKPLKDVMEMNGHDRTVLDILKMGKGEQRISEKRIKAIHKVIMHEDNPELIRQIGEWKEKPNEIINYKGEKIDFAPPSEVKERVHTLLGGLNAELDKLYSGKSEHHPLATAAQFHIDFVTIHPFYDGNGRVTRILTNLLLVSFGYPPVIIKEHHKRAYYQLLADIQVYGGQPDLFYAFIGERLLESQDLVLKALNGEDIEEDDDLDKEIDIWKKSVAANQKVGTIKKNDVFVAKLFLSNLKDLFDLIEKRHEKFNELFSENNYRKLLNNTSRTDYNPDQLNERLKQIIDGDKTEINNIGLVINHKGFNNDGLNLFDVYHRITIKFDDFQFHIGDNYQNNSKFIYSSPPSVEELKIIASKMTKSHFDEIKNKISKNRIN